MGGLHGKVAYRRYHRVAASAASDPFLALTMAAVQKQLVHVLNGQSNRFRQGECSSFESLAASVKRLHPDPDQNPRVDRELDPQGSAGGKVPEETMDRGLINRVNASFFAAMRPGVRRGETPDPQYDLPHAKLTQVCERLVQSSLLHGSLHKTLVFVRRVDTVTEMVSLLLSRFQREVDSRVSAWHGFLSAPPPGLGLREDVWLANSFWRSRHSDDDQQPDPEHERKPGETPDPEEVAAQFQRAKSLDYFEAIRRASKKHEQHGMLVSFQSRLLSSMDRPGPLAGFLLKRPDNDSTHPAQWEAAERHWQALLQLLCSGHLCERVGKVGDRLQHLHCNGADQEDWHYQATTGITALAAAHAASLHQLKGNFMTTQTDDLHSYGTLLSGAHPSKKTGNFKQLSLTAAFQGKSPEQTQTIDW